MANRRTLIHIILAASLLLFILGGCATITPKQQAAMDETIPVCLGKVECEAKWAAARNWVLNNAKFKIQIYSDDLIETYNPPPDSPLIAARVRKQPLQNGGYGIYVNVWCNNMFGCVPKRADAVLNFNNYINSIIIGSDTDYKNFLKKYNYAKPLLGIYFRYVNNKHILGSVLGDSPAAKGGLKPADVVTKVNGISLHGPNSFMEQGKNFTFGDEIEFDIQRDGQNKKVIVKLLTKEEMDEIAKGEGVIPTHTVDKGLEFKLEELNRLLKKGLITQDEFDKKKTQLLEEY